ncbi:MAG TPA: hypothetical protein VE591_11980 [Candidatus Acidoferrum sp.]|jgi:hypothetical protein|nr:hypothetical protein [Candidatus Acidoferrum sp.]
MKRYLTSAFTIAALALPIAASADTNSYAFGSMDQTVHGVVTSIDGRYGLMVRDDRSGMDDVMLHKGTIIEPKGLQLQPGMQITIAGHPRGGTFDANRIEAPHAYLEAQQRAWRAQAAASPVTPIAPYGPFQTDGPSAEGGG